MWIPTLSDRAATVTWMERGGLDVLDRARRLIREKPGQYKPLSLPEGMRGRLQRIIDSSVQKSQPAYAR
jgi:trimethylamine:corrinoid methyltransferase-like protein